MHHGTYTGCVRKHWVRFWIVCVSLLGLNFACAIARQPSQEPAQAGTKPQEVKSTDKPQVEKSGAAQGEEKARLPFLITLLETQVRFEVNGDSRKEVHTVVKINDAGGARQFARLGFDYNRAFQSVEIPLVKIAHANGGTSEVLPSAISDAPNPAVEKFPAYHHVRVKSVRILGLQEGDTLEYRVITTTTKPPLAPDFWLEHTFDRSGQVVEERYELELPANREIQFRSRLGPIERNSDNSSTRALRWRVTKETWKTLKEGEEATTEGGPDVELTTFLSWKNLSNQLWMSARMASSTEIWADAMRKTGAKTEPVSPKALYNLVAAKMGTVELPLDFARYDFREARDILKSGYASPQDKAKLLRLELAQDSRPAGQKPKLEMLLSGSVESPEKRLPSPSIFSVLLLSYYDGKATYYMNPGVSVAPFGVVQSAYRGKPALRLRSDPSEDCWTWVANDLPFPSVQHVNVDANIAIDGTLRAKIKYVMRGDNELMLRMAFHQATRERWNEVAGLLALSDGFRGHVESVRASDPMETEKPFEVEYEITQAKFVDWSKKPVRIPALLPQIALPDAPGKAAEKIELGTPLDVETSLTLNLPEGTTVQTPPATSVSRDYATYASKYDGHLNTLTASRRVHFLLREIAGDRAADYAAFVRAVQLDQAQGILLFPPAVTEKRK